MNSKKHSGSSSLLPIVGVGAFLIVVVVALVLQTMQIASMTRSLATLEEQVASTTHALEQYQGLTTERLLMTEKQDVLLSDLLYEEQLHRKSIEQNIEGFDETVGKLTGTVETLEKLTTTDEQLLQKYSQIYFLNEHYIPADLIIIDEQYDYVNGKQVSVHAQMWPFLEELLEDAKEDDIDLLVLSGYRSYEEQGTLKQMYTSTYGVGANTFSADQGYSEHQLGTAVDFTTSELGQYIRKFDDTEAYDWLRNNAYKYGFTMSYPEDNEYYMYEPWHWRFVGEELARELHSDGNYFYNLEQRRIDSYIPTLFD